MGRNKRTITLILFLFLCLSCKKEVPEQIIEKKEEVKSEKKIRTYVIYGVSDENIKDSTKIITLEEKNSELENLKSMLENYFFIKSGTLFPDRTSLRAIYILDKNVVVDISIPEDSMPLKSIREELYCLSGLARTICLNFPKYKAINVLINGSTENKFINHLALHISYKP